MRFDEKRASYYARHRPDYPAAALDVILEDLPLEFVAADIGAGTGISARQLAARGGRVFAVEPNAAMAAAAEADARIEWIDGTAERTGLDDGSCDLVLCAQSYHWFDPNTALAEFHRILRPARRLALFWNIRDLSDDFQKAYERILAGLKKPVPKDRRFIDEVELDPSLFTDARKLELPHEQRLTFEELFGRTMSLSYFPHDGHDHDRRIAELETLCANAETIVFRYRTIGWLATATD